MDVCFCYFTIMLSCWPGVVVSGINLSKPRTSELNCLFALNLTSHYFSYVYHIPVLFKDHMTSHDPTLQLAWQPTTHF